MLRVRHPKSVPLYAAESLKNAADSGCDVRIEVHWPHLEPGPSTSTAVPEGRLKIAVAEDESELRQFFAKVLPHLGYELVAVTASGEELVQACEARRPHVVISDVQLNRLSGPEAVGVIRQKYGVAAVFLVENPIEDTIAVREANAVVLAKPFRMKELTPAIEQAIERCPDSFNSGNVIECPEV